MLFVSCSRWWRRRRRWKRAKRFQCLMRMIRRIASTFESAKSCFNSFPLSVEDKVEIVGESSDRRMRTVVKFSVRDDEFEVVSETITIGIQSSCELVTHSCEIHRIPNDIEVIECASFDRVDGCSEQE